MAYLLDLMSPGLGHLASGRWLSGLLLLALWVLGEVAAYVAISFEVWAILAIPGIWGLLSLAAAIDLYRVRRRPGAEPAGCLRCLLLLPAGPVLGVVVALAVTSAVVRPIRVRSGSMTPSAVTGDVILAQMFGPMLFGVRLGDIVLVAHPQHAGRLLIKRIIGIAGDLIEIRGGELRRNGRQLSDCELRSLRDHETGQQVVERLEVLERRPYLVWDQPAVRSLALTKRVPEGQLFVVGDNRDRSGDSRTFGTVPVDSVQGIITARLYPRLTNRLYEAPIKARQAAYRNCSDRRSTKRVGNQSSSPSPSSSSSPSGAQGGGAQWPVYR